MVIYSDKYKKVYLMKLTCGNEENSPGEEKAALEYKMLMEEIENGSSDCKIQTVEVGVRERQFMIESI